MELYVKQQRERGGLAVKKHPGRQPILGEADLEWLRESLDAEPSLTLAERCDSLEDKLGFRVSAPTMYRWVKRLEHSR